MLERDIQTQAVNWYRSIGYQAQQSIRIHPCEFDIVVCEQNSTRLHSIEIKRSNWAKLLAQCIRAQLYFYYSTAVLPIRVLDLPFVEEFASNGVGLTVFWERSGIVRYEEVVPPIASGTMNAALSARAKRVFEARIAGEPNA